MNAIVRAAAIVLCGLSAVFLLAGCGADTASPHSSEQGADSSSPASSLTASTLSAPATETTATGSAATESAAAQAGGTAEVTQPPGESATNGAGVVTDPPHTGTTSDGTLLCGSYTMPQDQTTWTLVVNTGDVSCATARTVLDDFNARKGTPTARNAASVDGFVCGVNSPGGLDETDIPEYCNDPSTAESIQSYTISDWRQAPHPTHFELEMS